MSDQGIKSGYEYGKSIARILYNHGMRSGEHGNCSGFFSNWLSVISFQLSVLGLE